MDPAALIPMPDAIPAPWGWFRVLLLLTFLVHVLFMNMVVGGAVIAVVRGITGTSAPGHVDPPLKDLSTKLPALLALAVNFGVAPLLFLQVIYGHFFYTSSVLMAVYWLSVVGLVILAYYGLYVYDFRYDRLGWPRVALMGAILLLLLGVAMFFVSNMTMMLQPERWTAWFQERGGTMLNHGDPTVLPRWLHFMVGAVAVAGLSMALWWRHQGRKGRSDAAIHVESGMRWFTRATLVQIAVGLWFLAALPRDVMVLFLGGGGLETAGLLSGIVLGVTALYFGARRMPVAAAWTLLATLFFMALTRDQVREAYLAPWFSLSELRVEPQYGFLAVFLAALVLGLAVVAYIVKLALRAGEEG
jgi:hypothetical protein